MGTKRSPEKARKAKSPFKFTFGLDLDLDFDIGDFSLFDGGKKPSGEPQRDVRILRPSLDKREIFARANYDNARAFARQIDLSPGARTFAWLDGSFIFGDIPEALIVERRVGIKRLYICTLSMNQENVDGLKNCMILMGDELERLVLVFSGYQYSHEKFGLVPYMYQELDEPGNRVQIAFGRWHCKIMTLETVHGHTITIHGSANMRSSNAIEQIMVEVDNRELHDCNAAIMDRIAERFGTINHGATYARLKPVEGREAWEIFAGGEQTWRADRQEEEAAAAEAEADGVPDGNILPRRTGESQKTIPR